MPVSYLGRRRSRPVADAPALDGAELAKAWLVELVALSPLERAARLPGPRFAEDAPRLCAALVAALSGDAALDDLEPGGPLAPLAAGAGRLAAADTALEAVGALDALRTVTWAALLEAAERPGPGQVGELADRLAAVVTILTTAALEAPHAPGGPGHRGPLASVLRESRPGEDSADPHTLAEDETAVKAPADGAPPPGEPRGLAASVADRRTPAADALAEIEAALREAATAANPLAEAAARLRELGQVEPGPEDRFAAAATRLRETTAPVEEPRIRRLPEVEDASAFAGARVTPWTASIERRLTRYRGDALPFAVLCLELVDADRLVAADPDRDVVEMLEQAEAAILAQLRPADALIRERPGRYWLTAPDTDGSDGRALAHRIAAAVEDLPPHRGAAPQLAIGVTTCPADASDARTLESRAEGALFAARAGGIRVAGPPADGTA